MMNDDGKHRPRNYYHLRPRLKKVNYQEVAETELMSDTDQSSDYTSDSEVVGSDIILTISQIKKVKSSSSILNNNNNNKTDHNEVISNDQLPRIPFELQNFDDLYRLACLCVEEKKMFKDCQRLPQLFDVLKEIHQLIGLTSVKQGLFRMILFELQNLSSYWRHIIITGQPGLGKTTLANIIAKLMNRLGKVDSDEITIGNPLNMKSGWDGQTPGYVDSLVQEALQKSKVLLIDEAPSLNDNRRHSMPDKYGQECINMLMQLMDKYSNDLIVILAGYKEEMERNILQANKGFRRRIQWFFNIDPYTPEELYFIFLQKLSQNNLQISSESLFDQSFFQDQYNFFPFYGGSIDNFVEKIKNEQSTRTFGQTNKTVLNDTTIQRGFQLYLTYVIEPMAQKQQHQPHVEDEKYIH